MTVKELIEKLQTFEPSLDVCIEVGDDYEDFEPAITLDEEENCIVIK